MDLDGDGDLDILSGSYTGESYWFRCTGGREFEPGGYLTDAEGAPLMVGSSITPLAFDHDGDGDLDLVVGTRASGVHVFENVGTAREPRWTGPATRLLDSEGRRVDGSGLCLADWDGDGHLDLLIGGENGGVGLHPGLGRGDDGTLRLGPRRDLLPKASFDRPAEGTLPAMPGFRTKPHVVDWNGDGTLDLLVGDVTWATETLPPLTAEQAAEQAALEPEHARLQEAYDVLRREQIRLWNANQPVPDDLQARLDAANEALRPLAARMREFSRERTRTHGYVWLFLREAPQGEDPADAHADAPRASAGPVSLTTRTERDATDADLVHLTAELTIDEGFHVYASVPEGSPYPATALELDLPAGATVVEPWSTRAPERPSPDDLGTTWYEGTVAFTCTVSLADVPPDAARGGSVEVRFQACDHDVCQPPATLTLEWE